MKIRCIIVEDERVAREGLQYYIQQYDFLELAGCFSNASDALEFLDRDTVSLIFLDIEMPGISGLEMARQLEGMFPLIIFTTAYPQYALEGYSANTIGYLVKPIFPDDFRRVLQQVQRLFSYTARDTDTSLKQLLIKSEGTWLRIGPAEILYLKSMQNYVLIFRHHHKPLMTLQPLKEIGRMLPDFFTQTHRSYIVNIKQVAQLSGTYLTIGLSSIPVSRTRKKEVTDAFLSCHQYHENTDHATPY